MSSKILNFDDSVKHIKLHYREEYPVSQGSRATFGNVPVGLHEEITKLAKEYNMQIPMAISALLDFYYDHEEAFAKELATARKSSAPKKKRG